MARKVQVDENGRRIGETHPRSTVPDDVVVQIRDLKEYDCLNCPQIARRLGVALGTVRKIARYERRVSVVARIKEVRDRGEG